MRNGDSRAGIFAFLGATAVILFALVVIARYPSLLRRGPQYYAVFRSVPGLNLGDDVRYGGLLVGAITGMELDSLDATRIRVTFRVRRQTPMRVDTKATITQLGMLGQPYLNLSSGQETALPLPAGSEVQSQESLTFPDAMSRLGLFLDRADSLMSGAQKLTGGAPWDRLNRTFSRIDTLVGTAQTGTSHVLAQLDTTTMRLNIILARTERMVASADTAINSARPAITGTQQEAMSALRDLKVVVAQLRDALERGDRVEGIMRNLSAASENLARFSERLEKNPSSLLKQPQAPAKPVGPRP
ncbi:MAG: MlaD family protein [Gemmatimonadota bacterium]|nr:MlaD family protein [Gemmatimonadota bacterium]